LVVLFEFSLAPRELQAFFASYAIIPRELVTMVSTEYFTLLTSQFLHGGWLHLLGNMLYLWIFGDNIEEQLGHLRFLLFYLLTGLIAGLAQVIIEPASVIPIVGASGAIAGVLGGYLMLYPLARVSTFIPIFIFIRVELPAILVLGFWFITQFFNGVASIGMPTETGGGVAFFAHIGGFIAGFVLVRLFGRKQAQFPSDPNFTDHY
jgi:membrane associated rhomboid family serine protease